MGAQKKWTTILVPEKTKTTDEKVDNTLQKAEIERMKKLLNEKMKDPKLVKKAALIITDMFNPKK